MMYKYITVLDYLHLACFVYPHFVIQERVLHETKSTCVWGQMPSDVKLSTDFLHY